MTAALLPAMIDDDRPALPPGYRLIARESVGSTSDEARALVAAGAPGKAVVWARSQTAGRGRHGRIWDSPPGNLYCSVILAPDIPTNRLAESAFVAALAARDALVRFLPHSVALAFKWPNDLLADGKKIAGILIESEPVADKKTPALIIGVGVNIVSAPTETSYPAIYIAALGSPPRSSALLGAVIEALEARAAQWMRHGFAAIRRDWLENAYGLGRLIAVDSGARGAFAGLDEDGGILIGTAAGETRRIVSGSIRYL